MLRRPRRALVLVPAGALGLLSACVLVQDLGSTGSAADGGGSGGDAAPNEAAPPADAAPPKDAANDTTPDGPTGPGPYGALPSGYCCTSDDECRFRRCVETAGGRMCLDACSASRPGICRRPGLAFTCDGTTCQPSAGFACLDASTFVRGTGTTGACCTDSSDGLAGHECEANLCLAVGDQPWFCTRRCDGGADCPADYRCYPVGDRQECIPASSTYTCR